MIIAAVSLNCFHVHESFALTSACMLKLHKQAISDAITLAPSGLSEKLREPEPPMLKYVDTAHVGSPKDRMSYSAYFQSAVAEIRSKEQMRTDYLARMLSHMERTEAIVERYC